MIDLMFCIQFELLATIATDPNTMEDMAAAAEGAQKRVLLLIGGAKDISWGISAIVLSCPPLNVADVILRL
jgi:head-tail adaptor